MINSSKKYSILVLDCIGDTKLKIASLSAQYQKDGFVSAVDVVSAETALKHRQSLELAESKVGPLHYMSKIHTILQSPFELATNTLLLDVVEACIGPDILLYNVTYIIKEAHSKSHVSWHQDLTYWGFDCDDQISAWLALSPATMQSGCMKMLPGSHHQGRVEHQITDDTSNVLYGGQTIPEVDEQKAVLCELNPGQASFHHGWTKHASTPNISDDRRIGLSFQYIAPHVKQVNKKGDGALLVRGQDRYGYYDKDIVAVSDLDPVAMKYQSILQHRYETIAKAK